jgi:hypothetical protein
VLKSLKSFGDLKGLRGIGIHRLFHFRPH